MGKKLILALVLLGGATAGAQTQTSAVGLPAGTNTQKVDSVLGNKKFEENNEITDARLKAEEGSRSKYSMKFSLSYQGPPVGEPLAKDQPNPDNNPGDYSTALGGSVGLRYRFSPQSALSAGTGLSALTPFHGIRRFDVKTPYLSYDLSNRIGDMQMRNSWSGSVTTVPNYQKIGQVGGLGYSNSMVYNVATSGWALGLDTNLDYFIYNRDYVKKDGKASKYHIGLYPNLKYNISDKFSVNTSVAFMYQNLRSSTNDWKVANKTRTGRLGAGYAFTKSVYFSPYLNYYMEDFSWDTTTLNFATTFSIF